MLHIIVKSGHVIGVIKIAEFYGQPDTYLMEEFDYKVENLDEQIEADEEDT